MALILSLETSTRICSVALHDGIRLLAELEVNQEQAHASRLAPLIQDVLKQSSVTPKQLAAVATSAGPGSYTGLRIGTSTAKGLCYSLSIPLLSVPTLDVMAMEAIGKLNETSALFVPMIDARRMEVYCEVVDHQLRVQVPTIAAIIDENSFHELLASHKLFLFGDGADKCKSVLKHENAVFVEGIFPRAKTLGKMARRKFEEKEFEDLVNFGPFYLKEFVAKKAQSVF
jgi:tRNA threonylcarbamoyladenosine biosynthesis protein TsaB